MTAGDELERTKSGCLGGASLFRRHDDPAFHARTDDACRSRRHSWRSLSRGDDPDRAVTRHDCSNRRQCAFDQPTRIDRTKSGPDDRPEISAEIVESLVQCVCLGSDQAESPVTTSNFLRRELTTWLALSLLQSCSS